MVCLGYNLSRKRKSFFDIIKRYVNASQKSKLPVQYVNVVDFAISNLTFYNTIARYRNWKIGQKPRFSQDYLAVIIYYVVQINELDLNGLNTNVQ